MRLNSQGKRKSAPPHAVSRNLASPPGGEREALVCQAPTSHSPELQPELDWRSGSCPRYLATEVKEELKGNSENTAVGTIPRRRCSQKLHAQWLAGDLCQRSSSALEHSVKVSRNSCSSAGAVNLQGPGHGPWTAMEVLCGDFYAFSAQTLTERRRQQMTSFSWRTSKAQRGLPKSPWGHILGEDAAEWRLLPRQICLLEIHTVFPLAEPAGPQVMSDGM